MLVYGKRVPLRYERVRSPGKLKPPQNMLAQVACQGIVERIDRVDGIDLTWDSGLRF